MLAGSLPIRFFSEESPPIKVLDEQDSYVAGGLFLNLQPPRILILFKMFIHRASYEINLIDILAFTPQNVLIFMQVLSDFFSSCI